MQTCISWVALIQTAFKTYNLDIIAQVTYITMFGELARYK